MKKTAFFLRLFLTTLDDCARSVAMDNYVSCVRHQFARLVKMQGQK